MSGSSACCGCCRCQMWVLMVVALGVAVVLVVQVVWQLVSRAAMLVWRLGVLVASGVAIGMWLRRDVFVVMWVVVLRPCRAGSSGCLVVCI